MDINDLVREFDEKGITYDVPDFYDQLAFTREEEKDVDYLNNYSKFVALRSYSPEYLENARLIINKVTNQLYTALLSTGRKGACIDISNILVRMLEKQGIWCTTLKGSCVVDFSSESVVPKANFYSITEREDCTPGHFWVYAPPFDVIDISIGEQEYSNSQTPFKPHFIIVENPPVSDFTASDVISPTIYENFKLNGFNEQGMLDYTCTALKDMNKVFDCVEVEAENGSKIKYIPTATHASVEKLEGFGNMDFNGRKPSEFYSEVIEPSLQPA